MPSPSVKSNKSVASAKKKTVPASGGKQASAAQASRSIRVKSNILAQNPYKGDLSLRELSHSSKYPLLAVPPRTCGQCSQSTHDFDSACISSGKHWFVYRSVSRILPARPD